MSGFEDVTIEWKGTTYTVPPTKCMGLLAKIEEVIAPSQGVSVIDILAQPHKAHLTKIARAYGAALRYAGCQVNDEEVYLSLARDVSKGGADGFMAITALADGLLTMFFPEWAREEAEKKLEGAADQTQPTAPSIAE